MGHYLQQQLTSYYEQKQQDQENMSIGDTYCYSKFFATNIMSSL